ncbi:MAG: quinolinate synthase NadA [bacterium]
MDGYDPYKLLDLIDRVKKLKDERNALILVHNYQLEEVQEVADFTGDSYGLAKRATSVNADIVVLCGVRFMAEMVKLLNPDKTVLLPELNANCPMADMVDINDLRELKGGHPGSCVVSYVNTYIDVKAESDICCTSSNAPKIVRSIPEEEDIIFVPDIGLGQWTERVTGRKMILWRGFCPTHYRLLASDIMKAREQHPSALVIVHPECRAEVIDFADHVASTGGMVKFCSESVANEFIIGTEIGMLTTLNRTLPNKKFYSANAEKLVCPNMKMTTIYSVIRALEMLEHKIEIEERYIEPAKRSIERMLEVAD